MDEELSRGSFGLLTTELPHGFAVRYTPMVEPAEVGGYWYDLLALEHDRIGVVVGDFVGRALPAEAVMGRLRSAAQARLRRTGDPVQTLDELDRFVSRAPAAAGTTVFCAGIDQAESTVCYSSAGHPPPIVVAADAAQQTLDRAQGPALGVAEPRSRMETAVPLPQGATMLLYTGGVSEVRDERAVAALEDCAELHPEQIAEQVMTTLAPRAGDDDVALLLYRHRPAPLNLSISAEPTSLATIRAHMRRWLPAAAVDPDTAADVLLAVGEAASNAAEHATVGARHRVELTVTASVTGEGLRMTVSDNGCWKPPPEFPGNRGHGIRLIDALVDTVYLTATEHGTTVEMLKELR